MDKEKFRTTLEGKLGNLENPACLDNCCDVHCHDATHRESIDNVLLQILESLTYSANTCIPLSRPSNGIKSRIANWKEEVLPYKDSAHFWHSVWQSAGRQINTELYQLVKRTRNLYHFQIQKHKKMAITLKKNALFDACINNNGDIFEAIRKRRTTGTNLPTM